MRMKLNADKLTEHHNEMTRYAFISHMEDYMRRLVKDPLHADTDSFLKEHGIDAPTALNMLVTPSEIDKPDSAVISVTRKIIDNATDENGNRRPDTFSVKYKIYRKDYTDKMRNLYYNLFENNTKKTIPKTLKTKDVKFTFGKNGPGLTDELLNIGKKIFDLSKKYDIYLSDSFIDTLDDVYDLTFNFSKKTPVNEGAWGYEVLDNDHALDCQTDFAKKAISGTIPKLSQKNADSIWAWFGVMFDFLDKYKNDEIAVTNEYKEAVDACMKCCDTLLKNDKFMKSWSDEEKIKKQIEEYKSKLDAMIKKKTVSEDTASGGATSADASGQFVQPLFGKPIKRKSIYITEEQSEYLRKKMNEEAVTDTAFGDFGYDAPVGDAKNNKKNSFFADANDHNDIFRGGIKK